MYDSDDGGDGSAICLGALLMMRPIVRAMRVCVFVMFYIHRGDVVVQLICVRAES